MTPKVTGEGEEAEAVKKKALQFSVTFEPTHENKSCSACQERVNERMRECQTARVRECESV